MKPQGNAERASQSLLKRAEPNRKDGTQKTEAEQELPFSGSDSGRNDTNLLIIKTVAGDSCREKQFTCEIVFDIIYGHM